MIDIDIEIIQDILHESNGSIIKNVTPAIDVVLNSILDSYHELDQSYYSLMNEINDLEKDCSNLNVHINDLNEQLINIHVKND